ncbi:MAG: nucleotidyltransferase domain-containing protein [Nanoarchaeota archaeon]|nr:nucleotidyltransferase domain-containing protein [Nanoarchaeota archaeon]
MKTKDYTLEVVNELLNSSSHARELARKVKMSHVGVSKILSSLSKRNVVDYVTEGKNKIYSLKKTIESKTYIFMAEEYKLLKTIQKYPLLRNVIEKLQNNDKISIALLFGSYAKGIAGKESDIDIYIDTMNKGVKKEVEGINTKISLKIGNYDESSLLIKEINKNHVIIKGVEAYYVKRKFLD